MYTLCSDQIRIITFDLCFYEIKIFRLHTWVKSCGYLSFCICLLSLNVCSPVSSMLLQMIGFHFYGWIVLCTYTTFKKIHSSIKRHLGWFRLLTTISSATVDTGTQLSLQWLWQCRWTGLCSCGYTHSGDIGGLVG
jgi:hypothetical protein